MSVATPPDPKSPSLADAIMGLKLGRAFRDLGARTGREAIRALPMAVADLVQEVFTSEAVRGPLATRGVLYTAMGAWATGTAAVFLSDSAGTDGGAAGTAVFPVGGTGALADALAQAATALGVQVRTGAEVAQIRNRGTRAIGVTLADGTELNAPLIVSAADPKQTAALCDPVTLGPTMVWRAGNIRQPGATARVNLALSGLPAFHGGDAERLAGRIVLGPSIDDVERAMDAVKYGHVSEAPVLEATIPSLTDPSLAPEGKHVMSVVFQAAPYALRDGDWASERDRVGDIAIKALEEVAPGFGELVEAREVITPDRHGNGLRAHGRPHPARRAGARPVLRVAAAARRGALRVPARGPLPRGVRRAPRRRHHGRPRRERRAADPQRPQVAAPRVSRSSVRRALDAYRIEKCGSIASARA